MTLAGLEEAQVLLVLDLVSNAVVVAAGTATYGSSGTKFNPPWGSSLESSGGVEGAAGHSRHFIGIHGSRARSGGQDGQPHDPLPPTYFIFPWTTPSEVAGFSSIQLVAEMRLHPPFLFMEPLSQEAPLKNRRLPRNSGHGFQSNYRYFPCLPSLPIDTHPPFQAHTRAPISPSTATTFTPHLSSCSLLCPTIIPGIHFHNCLSNLLYSFTPFSRFYALPQLSSIISLMYALHLIFVSRSIQIFSSHPTEIFIILLLPL